MGQENEIRAHVTDARAIYERLGTMGAVLSQAMEQWDQIFDTPDAQMFLSGRKIRIRYEQGKDIAEVTIKGSLLGRTDVSSREESSFEIAAQLVPHIGDLLTKLGFPLLFQVKKRRVSAQVEDVKYTLDEWPIVGYIFEIEGEISKIKQIATTFFPEYTFGNLRLKDLFATTQSNTGLPLDVLIAREEEKIDYKLGNLQFLLR